MADWLLLVVLTLASYRIWRLAGRDDITAPLRDHLPSFVRQGVECPFCLGTWIAVAVVWGTDRWLTELHPNWPLWAFAVACLVGLTGRLDD